MAHGYKEVNGEVIYVTPNHQSISVCLVPDGDPDKVAKMLNFAVERGYGERKKHKRRKVRKDAGQSRGPQQKTLDRRRKEAFQGLDGVILSKSQDHCSCGSPYVLSGSHRRCKAGSRAYSTAYQAHICGLTDEPAYKVALAASSQKQRDHAALAGREARARLGCQTGTPRPGA